MGDNSMYWSDQSSWSYQQQPQPPPPTQPPPSRMAPVPPPSLSDTQMHNSQHQGGMHLQQQQQPQQQHPPQANQQHQQQQQQLQMHQQHHHQNQTMMPNGMSNGTHNMQSTIPCPPQQQQQQQQQPQPQAHPTPPMNHSYHQNATTHMNNGHDPLPSQPQPPSSAMQQHPVDSQAGHYQMHPHQHQQHPTQQQQHQQSHSTNNSMYALQSNHNHYSPNMMPTQGTSPPSNHIQHQQPSAMQQQSHHQHLPPPPHPPHQHHHAAPQQHYSPPTYWSPQPPPPPPPSMHHNQPPNYHGPPHQGASLLPPPLAGAGVSTPPAPIPDVASSNYHTNGVAPQQPSSMSYESRGPPQMMATNYNAPPPQPQAAPMYQQSAPPMYYGSHDVQQQADTALQPVYDPHMSNHNHHHQHQPAPIHPPTPQQQHHQQQLQQAPHNSTWPPNTTNTNGYYQPIQSPYPANNMNSYSNSMSNQPLPPPVQDIPPPPHSNQQTPPMHHMYGANPPHLYQPQPQHHPQQQQGPPQSHAKPIIDRNVVGMTTLQQDNKKPVKPRAPKKQTNPNAPAGRRKRPYMTEEHKQSGYAKFYQLKRKEIKVVDFGQASKIISDLWNNLSDNEKSIYARDVSIKRKEMLKKQASQQAQNLLAQQHQEQDM